MKFSAPFYSPPGLEQVDFELPTPSLPQPQLPLMTNEAFMGWTKPTPHTVNAVLSFHQIRHVFAQAGGHHNQADWCDVETDVVTGRMHEIQAERGLAFAAGECCQHHFTVSWCQLHVGDTTAGLIWLTRITAINADTNLEYGGLHTRDQSLAVSGWHVTPHIPVIPERLAYDIPVMGAVDFNLDTPFEAGPLEFDQAPDTGPYPLSNAMTLAWQASDVVMPVTEITWQSGVSPYRDPAWGVPDQPEPLMPDRKPPVQPQITESVQVMNSLQILALPEMVPIHGSISISHDIDSYCWSASIAVEGAHQLPYLRSTGDGPRELRVTMNGYVFRLFVERVDRRAAFPIESYTVTAYSQHRWFGEPWAPKLTEAVTTDTSALQLMSQLLRNTGFAIERPNYSEWRRSPDWTIAAGSYSYTDKTPIEVIKELLNATGAILLPHASEPKWSLQPRYLVSPWELAEAPERAFAHILPVNLNLDWESQQAPGQRHDAVLITGINHGVAVNVRRKGTAGTAAAPDICSDLFQDQQQCIEKARNVLSESGHKELMTLSLPLMPNGVAPELVIPGMLVKYIDPNHPAANFAGLCLSNTINTDSPAEIRQSVTIEVDNGVS